MLTGDNDGFFLILLMTENNACFDNGGNDGMRL